MLTIAGVVALSFMLAMYAFESRGPRFTLAFAVGCLLSAAYGVAARAWPFAIVEVVWACIALRRYQSRRRHTQK